MSEWLQSTVLGMSVLELAAVALGLVNVWLTVKQNVWCWPFGAAMVSLYAYVFFRVGLFADMGLQVVYFFLQFYGWYQWLYGGRGGGVLKVSRLKGRLAAVLGALFLAGTAIMAYLLHRYTPAAVPLWDSAATVLSLIAQWMMAKKILENWAAWIAVDVLSVGLYIYKDLLPTAALYAIFLAMCVQGHREWRSHLSRQGVRPVEQAV